MKIAIDIRAAGGEKAGKGYYTFNIVQNLLKIESQKGSKSAKEYILYSKEKIPGFDNYKNAKLKIFKIPGILWHLKVAYDIIKEKADIFFAPSSYIIPSILPKSVKSILTVHDLVAFHFPDSHNTKAKIIEKLLLKRALKKASRICTVSENTSKDILQNFKIDIGKMDVIHCAAGENFKPISNPKNTLKNFIRKTNLPINFFLAVGTLEPRKNYLNLIKAFRQINDSYPDYHLIIVGKNGWDYGPIYEFVKTNYLNKKVHFLGYLSEKSLTNLYNLAKALIFPSFYEGFGLPPLEAMQCACPVIASCTSSMPEVVGESALLINPESPEQIAAAMYKLIKDPDFGLKLREKGLKQAAKYSWEKSAEKLMKIFHDCRNCPP